MEFRINDVLKNHVEYKKTKSDRDSLWDFHFHVSLKREFFFKHNDKIEVTVFLRDTTIKRKSIFRMKTEKHFDIYQLNFGFNKNEVQQNEFHRLSNPDIGMFWIALNPNEVSLPTYGRFLTNYYETHVTNIYTFDKNEKLIAVSEYVQSHLWDKTNIISQCKAKGLKEIPVIINNKLDKAYSWTNGKIKYTLNQRLSERKANSLMGVTFEKTE